MSYWLISGWSSLGAVALKAALMYATALVGLRVVHRRTLAQWTAIDFAAAVAVGAIVGRTAVAGTQSLIIGIVALVTILAAHTVVTYARYARWVTRLTDHRVRVLVDQGTLRRRQLVRCGITEDDLFSELRRQGTYTLKEVRYVLYEPKGGLTIVAEGAHVDGAEVLDRGLHAAPEPASAVESGD